MTVLEFLVHYWLLTTAVIAGIWVLSIQLLRHHAVGPVGRQLAQREEQRASEYRAAVIHEFAALDPNDPTV